MAQMSEAPELKHTRGAVAMARSQATDSASAQFYFTLADLPFLDGSLRRSSAMSPRAWMWWTTSSRAISLNRLGLVSGLENLKPAE